VQPNIIAVEAKTDVLNADTNHRLSRTLDRVADKPLASPLIIRHVAGTAASDGKKDLAPATSTGHGLDSTSNADGLANMRGDPDSGQKLRDGDKKMEMKMAADAETELADDREDETGVAHVAAGCESTGVRLEDFAVTLERDVSQGYMTNAADRALRMAPFTHASYGVSLMCSEVAGGGGADSDDEMCEGNVLVAGTPVMSSKSPLGSSSSAQLSGHRSVQHMLKQIQDAGERINERISSRDFGARRRLPAVPADAINDSDVPTSSHSARSDGSGEAHPEHRPIRSVLEELPRPAIRSPKTLAKKPGSPSALSRQLPDASVVKNLARTDNQLIQIKPETPKLAECPPPDDEIGMKCKQQLFDPSSTLHSVLGDYLPNAEPLIQSMDVPVEEKQSEKLSDQRHIEVATTECRHCRHLLDTASKSSVVVDNQVTPMQPSYVRDILVYSADMKPENLKQLSNLAESEADANRGEFPDTSATKLLVPVDSRVNRVQSVYDADLLAYSVDLIASERCPEKLKWSESQHDVSAVAKLSGRGMADGESPRNTVNDEVDGKVAVAECLQSPMLKLSDVDSMRPCEQCCAVTSCKRDAVVAADGDAIKCTSADSTHVELNTRRTEALSKCDSDPMYAFVSSSAVATSNRVEFVAEDEDGPNTEAKCVCEDLLVKLQASVTSSDIGQLLSSDNQRCNEVHVSSVDCDQLAAVTMLNSSSPTINDADAGKKAGKLMDTLPSLHSKDTVHHDMSCILHNDKHICDEAVVEHAEERTPCNSIPVASIAKTSDKLKSGDNCLHTEAAQNINICCKTSDISPLTVGSSATATEINALNTKSSAGVVTNASHDSSGVKETFRLAGPKRVLSSQNSSIVVSSGSAVIKTGGKPLSTVANFAGNVTAKNDRSTGTYTPLIRSTHAMHTTTVNSTATAVDQRNSTAVAVNQRKPSSVAVKIGRSALSHITTGLPPPIRLSSHSPQPPTEPASRPAVAAAQARFV